MSAWGAYGYQLPTLRHCPGATEVDEHALSITVDLALLGEADLSEFHDPSDRHAMGMEIDLAGRRARLALPDGSAVEDILHPLLAPVIARFARHDGAVVFHAGALAQDGRALIVAGDRGAGKSTAMAGCALRGVDVLADDLAVVRGDVVFAGPRFLDLRQATADRLPDGTPTESSRGGARTRLELAAGRSAVPLGGIAILTWNEDVERPTIVPVSPQDRLQSILPHVDFEEPHRQAPDVLRMVQVPTWRVERPHSWEAQEECVDLLLGLAGKKEA